MKLRIEREQVIGESTLSSEIEKLLSKRMILSYFGFLNRC